MSDHSYDKLRDGRAGRRPQLVALLVFIRKLPAPGGRGLGEGDLDF